MYDRLRRRRVWTTRRKGKAARPSPYCIDWYDSDGRRRRLCYPSRDEQLTAQRLKYDELNAWAKPAAAIPWGTVLVEHFRAHALLSEKHVSQLGRTLAYFTELVRPSYPDQVTPSMCDAFFQQRAAGHGPTVADPDDELRIPSIATLHRERRELSGFFAWCVEREYARRNPISGVKLPAAPRRLPRRPGAGSWTNLLAALNRDEIRVDDPQAWHVLILLGVATGVRQAPLLNCYLGVPIDDKSIAKLSRKHPRGFTVVHLAGDGADVGLLFSFTGKTQKEEVFGLPPIVNERIARRVADLPDGAEFLPWSGRWQRKAWRRIGAAAQLDIAFHVLRSLSGTTAAVSQARTAARAHLGHFSAATTVSHYLDSEAVARAVAAQQTWPELPPLPAYRVRTRAEIRGSSRRNSGQ